MTRRIKLGGEMQHIKILSADYSKYTANQLFHLSGDRRRYVKEGDTWRFFTQAELEAEEQQRVIKGQEQQKRELFKMARILNEKGLLSDTEKDRIKNELGV